MSQHRLHARCERRFHYFGMGGNFVAAMSDTLLVEEAMARVDLTVHVSTKLNHPHVAHGPRH